MWPNLLPSGAMLPAWALTFDLPVAMGVEIVLVVVVLAFVIARLSHDRSAAVVVFCPGVQRKALVVVQRSNERLSEVARCSRWHLSGETGCERSCIRLAA